MIMEVRAIKTRLVKIGDDLTEVIGESIESLPEKAVVVIASKIFSYCEKRLVKRKTQDKQEKWDLAKRESDWWLDPSASKYQTMLTIKNSWIFANAGIDESNSLGNYFSLWPKDPQQSVVEVWRFLRRHYGVRQVGVIMSDSSGIMLNWGVVGHGIAHCGFEALKSYIGKPDLHGRLMQMEQVNMTQSICAAATLEMGEGAERTPMAVVTGVRDLVFQDREPTKEELDNLRIALEDDIYAPLLLGVDWRKGEGGI